MCSPLVGNDVLSALCVARRNRDRRNNSRPGLLQGFGKHRHPPLDEEFSKFYSASAMPDTVTQSLSRDTCPGERWRLKKCDFAPPQDRSAQK